MSIRLSGIFPTGRISMSAHQPVLTPYTNLLMPFNGTNNSTTMTDVSGNWTPTATGAARLSTALSYSSPTSLLLDGTANTQVNIQSGSGISGTQNFTIEFWMNQTAAATGDGRMVISQYGWYINNNSSFTGNILPNGTFYFSVTNDNSNNAYLPQYQVIVSPATPIVLNTWTHIAIVRNGAQFRVYKNGVSGTPGSHASGAAYSINSSTRNVVLGYLADVGGGTVQRFTGYIDDLRISKGIAVYTSNFTPPAPFTPPY